MSEETRPISWANGYYITSQGRVLSTLRSDRHRTKAGELRELKSFVGKHGYAMVSIATSPGIYRKAYVHHLVAEAFLPPPLKDQVELRHLDGCKTNNTPENLKHGTCKENAEDREAHGHHRHGSRQPISKLTEADVILIRHRLANGERVGVIAREYSMSHATISVLKSSKTWKHVRSA